MTSHSFRCFWGPREETPDDCAGHVLKFIVSLKAIDAHFAEPWFECLSSLKSATPTAIKLRKSTVVDLLVKGMNHTDIPRLPIAELGFTAHLASIQMAPEVWTYKAVLDVHCGVYTP